MNFKRLFPTLLLLTFTLPVLSFAQANAVKAINHPAKKQPAFYKGYLAKRKKQPGVDTNLMAGMAVTGYQNTYISKRYTDNCIYNSYWPIIGDTLIYVTPVAQKICVVKEIDSCEILNRKYHVKKNEGDYGNHMDGFFLCEYFECGIVAQNISSVDFTKEKVSSNDDDGYAFRYKKTEQYKTITNQSHINKIVDSIKKANYLLPQVSGKDKVYFNFRKGIVTLYPEGKDTITRFEVDAITYVNNTIRYLEIHEDNNGDNEVEGLYLFTNSGLYQVYDSGGD